MVNSIPDYFMGRLIYELDDGDSCRWAVYDGDKVQRFLTRARAEEWCVEHTKDVGSEEQEKLKLATSRITSGYLLLDKVAPLFINEREVLEGLALELRQIVDKIDIIRKICIKKELHPSASGCHTTT